MKRCSWPGEDPLYLKYHDEEWGRPVVDDRRLLDRLGEKAIKPPGLRPHLTANLLKATKHVTFAHVPMHGDPVPGAAQPCGNLFGEGGLPAPWRSG